MSEKNILMQQLQENGTYDQLYPKTNSYSKSETLTNETSQMFGIDNGTPEQILQYLGKYNQYWWKRELDYTYIQNRTSGSGKLNSNSFTDDGGGVNYSYSNQVTYTGNVSEPTAQLVINEEAGYVKTSMSVAANSWPTNTKVLGKYFNLQSMYKEDKNKIFFIPEDAVLSVSGSTSKRYLQSSAYELITYSRQDRVFDGYVQSSNRDAYPDSDSKDGYYYTFLGIPLSNAVLLAITGEYL